MEVWTCGCPQALPLHARISRQRLARHNSPALSVLAPHLLKLAKVVDCGALHTRPLLHTVPICHGRFPVKSTVIRNVPQKYVLHLAGDLSPLLHVKRPALFGKELIKLLVAIFAQVGRGTARKARIIGVRIVDGDRRKDRIGLKIPLFGAVAKGRRASISAVSAEIQPDNGFRGNHVAFRLRTSCDRGQESARTRRDRWLLEFFLGRAIGFTQIRMCRNPLE